MAIKTDELQQLASALGTDSVLLDTGTAGTARLSLANLAKFLTEQDNAVKTALSSKAAKSAQDTVEKTGASARTVELAASELPGFFKALPRLLTENLTVKASGILSEYLDLHDFCGFGSIWIEGSGGCAFQKGLAVRSCSIGVTLKNLEISGRSEISSAIANIQISRYVSMQYCTVTGSNPNDGEEKGVQATLCSHVNLTNCGIQNCKTAVLASGCSLMTVYNDNGDGFLGNITGPYAHHGGIILLSGQTPELLGGAAVSKSGGLIVKKDGTLL